MKGIKHRIGCGYESKAPTGLIEHSKYGLQMERAFESKFINKLFEFIMKFSTSDTILTAGRGLSGGKLMSIIKKFIDLSFGPIDNYLFKDKIGAKKAFLGKINAQKYRSAFGGFILELLGKYLNDWKRRQEEKRKIHPPIRVLNPLKKTYKGWKQLREDLQPGWRVFPEDPKKGIIKIFNEDTMNPRERLSRILQGKETDRVGFGPMFDWGVTFMGGTNNWKFCYDGIETGWASLNTWIRCGGMDFIPNGFGAAAYAIPYPNAHSQFFYKWMFPKDNLVPQFLEKELLKTYDDLYNYGISGLAQEISKRMIRDAFILVREIYYLSKIGKQYFGPYMNQFLSYSDLIFDVWDLIPMWRSMIPFMKDMRRNPESILEAFEFLNKPLTDLMIKVGKLSKAKTALFGNSRGSNSWVSPKMFEELFWPSMKYSFDQCLKNDIIPVCHFDNDWTENMVFLSENLPKRSCIFHLDQVDLVKVHELIGDSFCLMGGMGPDLLVFSSPQKIEAETKRYIENIGEDGLIIASGCEYPADIPIQNVFAQKRAIKDFGFFRG